MLCRRKMLQWLDQPNHRQHILKRRTRFCFRKLKWIKIRLTQFKNKDWSNNFLYMLFMILPIHWPSDGRTRVAPIPAPMEAKTKDEPHLIEVRATFCPRSWTFLVVSCLVAPTLLSSTLALKMDLKNRYNSMPTWTTHDAVTPSMCPVHNEHRVSTK